ncbi:ethanolamine utilization protein EutN/carboxysome structural protein Ccml [Melioribacter roseus P3M-2]|uniref:Ethanolamine utilization protein EutN/carboxysome structural protein Ccml n=1 Tax=Melioribacter roseus (strain DSM 23840 / JCM 17771 / VKM B-2668 / P3M-2) TaxID=1191523 RepID=I6YS13_MELRP|nr:EutN/CcmL family microcompartment protein [Melioribacter roseus]AFN73342.1 ethanolamine utilization protein EutN/carboxysome structural protein Ccml [Melioribacter roseus P3M-2]
MIFAKVIGSVVSTHKDPKLTGKKMLLCKEVNHEGKPMGSYHVAIDAVQAGEGDFVLLTYGSSARMTETTKDSPIDAVIVAIIDDVQITKKITAQK